MPAMQTRMFSYSNAVMLLVGGLVGFPTWNLGVRLTLFQPRGTDYAHHITDCPHGFENIKASLQ